MPEGKRVVVSVALSDEDASKFKAVLRYYRDLDNSDSLERFSRSDMLRLLLNHEHARLVKEKKI